MSKITFQHAINIPRENYERIGEVIFRFSLLDFQLIEILAIIMGLGKKQMRLAYVNSDFKGKLTVLATLASKWVLSINLRNQLNDLRGKAHEAENIRNLYAHSIFGVPQGKTAPICILQMRTGEQRHLPDAEPFDEAFWGDHLAALRDLNCRAQSIYEVLRERADDPKVLKQPLRLRPPSSSPEHPDANLEEASE